MPNSFNPNRDSVTPTLRTPSVDRAILIELRVISYLLAQMLPASDLATDLTFLRQEPDFAAES